MTPLAISEGVELAPQAPFVLTGSSETVDLALSSGRVCAVLASGGVAGVRRFRRVT